MSDSLKMDWVARDSVARHPELYDQGAPSRLAPCGAATRTVAVTYPHKEVKERPSESRS